jgi:hypothetical protein
MLFRKRRKLKQAAREVVREYVCGTDDSLALSIMKLRCVAFDSSENITKDTA